MTTPFIDLDALDAQLTADFEAAQERARAEFLATRTRRHESTAKLVEESENVARLRSEFAAAIDRHAEAWNAALATGLAARDLSALSLDARVADARRLLDPPRSRSPRKTKAAPKTPEAAPAVEAPERAEGDLSEAENE